VGAKTRLDVTEKKKISCLYRKWNRDSSVVQPIAQSLYRQSYPGSMKWVNNTNFKISHFYIILSSFTWSVCL
jgi:hypothetical protein